MMSFRIQKRFMTIISLLSITALLFSCASGTGENANKETTASEENTSATQKAGDETTAENSEKTQYAKVPESLKILAIGNSFSTDGMQYLYDIAKSAGVKEVVLGNLYIGACSLETHLSRAKSGASAYTYYKNNSGTWTKTENATFLHGLLDEDWDYISLQQASADSGVASTYGKTLISLIGCVETQKTNPDAKLVWHMTWAYQQNSTHSAFPVYGRSQAKMYGMITEVVKNEVLPTGDFALVIPAGTAIQNARTSFTGDTLTRDGHHLSLTLGRYIASLCWYAAITGADITDIKYTPSADVSGAAMAMAKEAVINAILNPYEVAESTYKEGSWKSASDTAKTVVLPEDCFEGDKALAASIGIDLDGYIILDYKYLENGFYYCTQGTSVTTPAASSGTYLQHICTAKIYSKSEIPEKSVIICDSGWQYRPERWVSLSSKAASRPATTSAPITLLDSSWWGQSKYLALNISSNPKADISTYYDAAASHVRIYIPESAAAK